MNFPEKLRELRVGKGITQEALAKEISVSRTLITKYECGVVYPTNDNIQRLAAFFEVQVEDLINHEDMVQISLDRILGFKKIEKIVDFLIIGIVAFYNIFVWLPVFVSRRFIYPIPSGQTSPSIETQQHSLMTATIQSGNPIGIITTVTCLINVILTLLLLSSRNKKNVSLLKSINYILFAVNIVLIFFSIAFAIVATNGNLYDY